MSYLIFNTLSNPPTSPSLSRCTLKAAIRTNPSCYKTKQRGESATETLKNARLVAKPRVMNFIKNFMVFVWWAEARIAHYPLRWSPSFRGFLHFWWSEFESDRWPIHIPSEIYALKHTKKDVMSSPSGEAVLKHLYPNQIYISLRHKRNFPETQMNIKIPKNFEKMNDLRSLSIHIYRMSLLKSSTLET